jgi:hypothetical protein
MEQCDDGNTLNLDGCDAACAFEQDHRSNSLQLQYGTDAFCAVNKFGAAIAPIAQGLVQGDINTSVASGASGFMFKFLGLDTLTGAVDDPTLQLGVVTAKPVMGMGYTGADDLDWWYTTDAVTIDATRTPLDKVPASITAGVLNAGPGSMTLPVALFSTTATPLRVSGVKLQIALGPLGNPLISMGTPPGHLASEHLNPALMSFYQMGTAMPGKLCSNVSAKSLLQETIPAQLLPGGQFACTQAYSPSNSLLDVLVSGCNIAFFGPVILPSQPDQVDPALPQPGAGGPYVLQVNAQKMVSTCLDKNGAAVSLSACLPTAAYSSYFQFTTDRVILK